MGRCTGKTQQGRRCKANAVSGTNRCMFHGGMTKPKGKSFRKTSGKKSKRRY